VDGKTYRMDMPFIVIATQNPIEHEGTYRLPEAEIDRFLFKIKIDYPSKEEESQILISHHERKHINDIGNIKAVISEKEIIQYKETVRGLHTEKKLMSYITDIIHSTRNHPSIYLGGSPRAALAVLIGAKAIAAINGRDFVTPEDIKRVCIPALAHRILLTPEREMEGITPEQVLREILMQIEVPR
jgi:MoxR-like ATPase